ncbi:MAG: hypothetical protein FJY85_02540 [Deltaproteobacteria bacterium]|nr:hypothetical protein [Deltaproteobacteria bacterium]
MEYLAGFESWQTDKFRDLALSLRAFPRGGKHQVFGLGWHHFTAFNHFINPYPEVESSWSSVSGYTYPSSSMAGFDSVVVQGISKCLQGLVDTENSPVLDRIRPFWKYGEQEWNNNFERELGRTEFAPWSILAQVYYEHFILEHYEPLEVRGANEHIVGLQLLGPVIHAVADACSPQHVRSALGFGHSIWENYVKSRAYDRRISVEPGLVLRLLKEEPFEPRVTRADGPLKGKFDVENFVRKLSVKTADRLIQSTSRNWKDLWQAEGAFWRRYLTGSAMREDAHFFYNMAVAGTVHALARSYQDLISQGILSPDSGLVNPEKMPDLDLFQKDHPDLPTKRTGRDDLPPEEVMPVPYNHPRDLVGFDPEGDADLPVLSRKVRSLIGNSLSRNSQDADRSELLKLVERAVTAQYTRMAQRVGDQFCPMRVAESIPVGSDLSAHFGTATFRMPSAQECDDPSMFEQYIAKSDSHAYLAYTLQLTQALAALRFYRTKFAGHEAAVARLDYIASKIEQFRDAELPASAQGFTVASPALAHPARVSPVEAVTSEMASSVKGFLSDLQERISAFFNVVPKAALATVAVAALLLIIVIPRGGPEHPVLGLSPESWTTPGLTMMGPRDAAHLRIAPKSLKPRLAVLVYFKGVKGPVDQEIVDSAYRAVFPTALVRARFDLLTPEEVKAAVENGLIGTKTPQETLDGLHQQLKVNEALVVTIAVKRDLFDVETTLSDLDRGKPLGSASAKDVQRNNLAEATRKSVQDLLCPKEGNPRQ